MTDAVSGLLDRGVRAGMAPAMVARWGRRGEEAREITVGHAAVAPRRVDAGSDTWFDLASLTKPLVTTTLSLLALRSGAITPTSRVGEVLTSARGTPIGDLEIHNLLTHTSGLPAWLPLYCLAEGDASRVSGRISEIRLEVPPNKRVIYSCIGFVLLGLMLESVAGEGLRELFQRQVLTTMGLEDELDFVPDPATHSLSAGAMTPQAETLLVRELGLDPAFIPPVGMGKPDDGNARFLGGVAGNAGLFGTARGVFALMSEFLPGGGMLLSSTEAADAIADATVGLEQGRGLGWQLASTPECSAGGALSASAYGHSGFTGVSAWAAPETLEIFVLLTNRNHPAQRGIDLHPLRRRFHNLASRSFQR